MRARLSARTLAALALLCRAAVPASAAPTAPDTFTRLDIAEADSLDPAWPTELVSEGVILSIYETLFAFDAKGGLTPLLASKVPSRANGLIAAGGRDYVIPIREGAHFQDGSPLTPEDVRYSLLRFMLQDRDGGPSSILLQPLLGLASTRDAKGVPLPDAYARASKAIEVRGGSIVLHLPAPFAPLPTILASRCPIVSRRWAAANGDWDGSEAGWTRFNNPRKQDSPFFARANGTGPFVLARWDRKTAELVLERNDAYWGTPAKLKRVVTRVIPELAARKLALQAGDADAIDADIGSYSQLKGLPGVRLIDDLPRLSVEPIAYFNFAINPAGNPNIGSGKLDGQGIPPDFFADKDVRKAFAYAFDYPGFIRDLYRGKAIRATGCIPSGLLGHDPTVPVYEFDLAKAEKHFRKAWGGKAWENGFTFVLTYNSGNTSRRTLCQMLKRSLEGLNPRFHVDVRPMEWPSYLDAAHARRLPMYLLNLSADYPDPNSLAFEVMHSRGNDPSLQGYKNPEADRLVEAALAATDPVERRRLYRKLQLVEHEDLPHLLFVEAKTFRVQREWLKGTTYSVWSSNPRLDAVYKEGD